MSEQWIDTEFSDKAPTIDALEAQLDGESWSSRIQRDPLFAAQLAVVDCSDEVVKRTEHYEARITELESGQEALAKLCARYEARIAELERQNALLTAFVVAEDAWNAHADCAYCWDDDDALFWQMTNARQALTDAGFPDWSDQ